MAVPDQMADSFLCRSLHLPAKTPVLRAGDAKYGTYYLSASRLNYGEEESPAPATALDERERPVEGCRMGRRSALDIDACVRAAAEARILQALNNC
jgi:hypothetical protein